MLTHSVLDSRKGIWPACKTLLQQLQMILTWDVI